MAVENRNTVKKAGNRRGSFFIIRADVRYLEIAFNSMAGGGGCGLESARRGSSLS
jgi:hypothetical protein